MSYSIQKKSDYQTGILFLIPLLILFLLCLQGCSGIFEPLHTIPEDKERISSKFMYWAIGQSVHQNPLAIEGLTQADIQFVTGEYESALESYTHLQTSAELNYGEQEALLLRRAAALGELQHYDKGLRLISNFLKKKFSKPTQVRGPTAVMTGFLYQGLGNNNQAIAWLLRGINDKSLPDQARNAAKHGLAWVIANSRTNELPLLKIVHHRSPLVQALIRLELRNRTTADEASDGAEENAPKIVVLVPLSGENKKKGLELARGVALGVNHFPGKQTSLNVDYIDTNQDTELLGSILKSELETQKIHALIGTIDPEKADVAAALARESKVPFIHFTTGLGAPRGDGVYQLAANLQAQIKRLIQVIMKRKINRLGIAFSESQEGFDAAQIFAGEALKLGLQVLINEPLNDETVEDIVVEVEDRDVQALFIPGPIDEAETVLTPLPAGVRSTLMPLGLAEWNDPEALLSMEMAFNRAVFVAPYQMDSSMKALATFKKQYRYVFEGEPDFDTARGYDAVKILLKSIAPLGSRSMAYKGTTVQGLTGPLKVTQSGTIERALQAVQLHQGVLNKIM